MQVEGLRHIENLKIKAVYTIVLGTILNVPLFMHHNCLNSVMAGSLWDTWGRSWKNKFCRKTRTNKLKYFSVRSNGRIILHFEHVSKLLVFPRDSGVSVGIDV